ncbi:polysaccharide deacetylase family protein [Streptococcus dentapri]|uniref:Polysaccharide deacetylase family protein n=1 Tax=Streptococcus dentapri TaxID=573564 RepID=A0ABV8CZX9_9STRE
MSNKSQHHPPNKNRNIHNLLAVIAFIFVIGSLAYLFKIHSSNPSRLLKAESSSQTNQTAKKSFENEQDQENDQDNINWKKQDETVKVPILMYHAIHVMADSESGSANLIVAPDTFESHIKSLSEQGYYFLTPEEAYKVLSENVLPNGNKKIIWLTFDDGDADFYTNAYPIMKKYKARGSNNIITSYIGKEGFLTVDQLKEMKKNGMSFQSHTVNHPDLSATSDNEQGTELTESKSWLDSTLNQDTIALAYPSGRYTDTSLSLAEKLGYKMAVTTNEGLASAENGLYALNRVRILPTTSPDDLLSTISW